MNLSEIEYAITKLPLHQLRNLLVTIQNEIDVRRIGAGQMKLKKRKNREFIPTTEVRDVIGRIFGQDKAFITHWLNELELDKNEFK